MPCYLNTTRVPEAADRRAASRISVTTRLFSSDDRPAGLISCLTTVRNGGGELRLANVGGKVQNLFVITDYTGFDPEVDTNKQINGVNSAGMDYYSYPASKGWLLGVTIGF